MVRVGIGTDRHRLVAGRKLIVGGIHVEFYKGAQGHSDADVLAHAVIDALLGAAGMGDIGYHFPDSDPKWKDADSMQLMAQTVTILRRMGFEAVNVDASVHLETPKLGPLKMQMARAIADTLKIPRNAVNVKAKTGEGLDAVGHGEAIEAVAVAAVRFDQAILDEENKLRGTKVTLPAV
ncbi:MAG TPA: 2-C-methyl-D-erythritol 2,4-cyclodiphosphate synthase [Planctomycetota bacterium]|nr:2-C-methyl-D-erythritol 2,4-cyclodiphosphate synthase [Planctomycetota bacterium]